MDATKIAKMYLRNLQSAHRPVHEYRVVDGGAFRCVSQSYYRSVQEELTRLGFSNLGDIEDVTLAKYGKPALRTFIRIMVDADRTTMAAFFHLAPKWWWRVAMWAFGIPSKCIDLESHSRDDFWAITTTAPKKSEQPRPADIEVDYAPRSLSKAELYQRHRQTMIASGRSFDRINTLEDAIKQEVEQQAKKREYLVSIGWVTPEYIAAQGLAASMVPAVYAESQRLLSEGFDGTNES